MGVCVSKSLGNKTDLESHVKSDFALSLSFLIDFDKHTS